MFDRYRNPETDDSETVGSLACMQCGKEFADLKALRLHQKSHRQKPCKWCDQMFSVNGLPRHEKVCARRKNDDGTVLVPGQALAHQIAEWLEHVHLVPENAYVVLCQGQDPQFVKHPGPYMVEHMNKFASRCCITFPANRIDPDLEQTEHVRDQKDRRKPEPEDDFFT